MVTHIRIVRALSALFGATLIAWAAWGLATQGHSSSVAGAWLVLSAFALVLAGLGVAFGRTRFLGSALLGVASLFFLLYTVVWLFLGGVEDAGNYWPAIVLGLVFFGYANCVSYNHSAG